MLNAALDFASAYVNISDKETRIILYARKTLLINNESTSSYQFDVAMGSYDGAVICELIGIYILNTINELFNKVELHQDEGLPTLRNCSAFKANQITKNLTTELINME